MNRRKMLFLMTLLAAGGGPYLLLSDGFSSMRRRAGHWIASLGTTEVTLSTAEPAGATPQQSSQPSGDRLGRPLSLSPADAAPQAGAGQTPDLRAIFNFNITPGWVVRQWPRVSTALGDLSMQGMRVALVTGTGADDLHGALTYYFDDQHRLQRISFQGRTGDARRLIALVTEYHGFRPVRTLDAGLFLKRWNGKPTGVLWLGHAPLVRADSPTSRLEVLLEINRTDGPYRLSDEMARFLAGRRKSGRW